MVDGRSVFDQPVEYILRGYDSNRKIITGQVDG